MCGIAGILDANVALAADELGAIAHGMGLALAHRGPDDAGSWVDAAAGVALTHRRLAIIDLSREGHQPMTSSEGRYVVSFNGEIYNHLALRAQLESAGHRFRGHSDTEVLLAAIVEWGPVEALRRSNGMFAAALWDRRERRLHLFRDRFGEKPLYYGWFGREFLFASELKALRQHPGFRAGIDREALSLFLRYGYVPAPRCIYAGIAKALPGTLITVAPASPGRADVVTYWSAREAIVAARARPFRGDAREAIAEIERVLSASVRLRMAADVPLGAFLSGGVDSSTVVALMQRHSGRPVKTFTIGFERRDYDEAPQARAVASQLGTDHAELTVTGADLLGVVHRLPELYDEPFSDSSQIPTVLMAELARRSVTVALSGDGGDEVFGGYRRYALGALAWKAIHGVPHPLRSALARGVEAIPGAAWGRVFQIAGPSLGLRPRSGADARDAISGLLRARDAAALYRRLLTSRDDAGGEGTAAERARGDDAPAGLALVERMMFWDTAQYLPDDILTKVDRATMSVGLEARLPLLDPDLFELAWRLPLGLRFARGRSAGKPLLRAILRDHVPGALIDQPKRGFSVPLAEWLRGPLRAWAQDLLSPAALKRDALLDGPHCAGALADLLSGVRDRGGEVWNALVFQSWLAGQRARRATSAAAAWAGRTGLQGDSAPASSGQGPQP